METTIKNAMAMALKRHLIKINEKLIAKEEKQEKKRKFSRDDIAQVEQLHRNLGWDAAKIETNMKIFSILLDAPELKAGSMPTFDLNCVVVLEANASGHGMNVNKPYILTYVKERHVLIEDGRTTAYSFGSTDKPRLASIEEINQCVDSLSPRQWKAILGQDDVCLKNLYDAVNGEQVTVVRNEDSDNGEPVNIGRMITVDKE